MDNAVGQGLHLSIDGEGRCLRDQIPGLEQILVLHLHGSVQDHLCEISHEVDVVDLQASKVSFGVVDGHDKVVVHDVEVESVVLAPADIGFAVERTVTLSQSRQ